MVGLKGMGFILAVCRLVRFLSCAVISRGLRGRDAPASGTGTLEGVALLDQPQSGAVRSGRLVVRWRARGP